MRLFVALLPPPAALAELDAGLTRVRGLPDADALRWTAREGWHLTLAFLGEVPEETRPDLDERLARAARRHGPYELRLAGGGRFGDRTLWAGAEGDLTAVGHLADSVRAAARRAGAPAAEEHGFHAHLTLARARQGARVRLRPFADALADFRGSSWTAGTLSLVASIPPRSGVPGEQPHYRSAVSWPLGPATAARLPER
ncbi:RNA 2',3'-cyclic phosphodiesterase [Streptomyces sp. HPF1205]|uniref:RNA 2',3'-cyclic phosphodiesterase n=1 Tax=Streptomyces sp. HPF1205 TaxID=2873262 RepID=UPI001CED9F9F|nr:RNA 2',3'-cyclic phosphodiesterase [Streptomyces sp. HPF1205]